MSFLDFLTAPFRGVPSAPVNGAREADASNQLLATAANAVDAAANTVDAATQIAAEAAQVEAAELSKLEELIAANADDDSVDAQQRRHARAVLRAKHTLSKVAEAKAAHAAAVAAMGEAERVDRERRRDELVAASSPSKLRADNQADAQYVVDALPGVVAALERITGRFDAANRAVDEARELGAQCTKLDTFHTIAGMLSILAERDPMHASHFVVAPLDLRNGVEMPAFKPTRLSVGTASKVIAEPAPRLPNGVPTPHDVDDMEAMLACRDFYEAEAVLHERQRAREKTQAESPAVVARRAQALTEFTAEQDRIAGRGSEEDGFVSVPAPRGGYRFTG